MEYLLRQLISSMKFFSSKWIFSVTAIFRASKDCLTSYSSESWAARVKMLMMTLQPDLM